MKKTFQNLKLLVSLLVCSVFCTCLSPMVCYAENGISASTSQAVIDVRVKADVPTNFQDSVTLNYVGKRTEGFTVILTSEENYSTIISIPKDIYTFKSQNVSDGYTIKTSKNFSLENAELNTVYLLPLIVTESTTITNDSTSYVNIKVVAEPQYEASLSGTYDITYSGTGGNSFVVTLCEANEYSVEMPIAKDIYTLKNMLLSDDVSADYQLDSLYSFNTIDANSEEQYVLKVKVYNKEDAPVSNEPVQEIVKEISVYADFPPQADFHGTISATYVSDTGNSFEAILNESNNYKQRLYAVAGTYTLSYAVSYDTKIYTFSGMPTFNISDSTDYMEVPIYMLKDGVVLTEESFLEEKTEPAPETVSEPIQEKKSSSSPVGIILVLVLLGVIGFVVYKNFLSKKTRTKEAQEEEEDTDEEDVGDIDSDEDDDENLGSL